MAKVVNVIESAHPVLSIRGNDEGAKRRDKIKYLLSRSIYETSRGKHWFRPLFHLDREKVGKRLSVRKTQKGTHWNRESRRKR
jgi:hypothetical protein